MNILCLFQGMIVIILVDGCIHIWHVKHIVDILYEQKLSFIRKIFGNLVRIWYCCFPYFLKVETGSWVITTGYAVLTRKPSYRKDDRAIIQCALYMGNERTKFEVRSFTRSCDNRGYPKNWAVSGYAHAPFSPKYLMGFCSDRPCECSGQVWSS